MAKVFRQSLRNRLVHWGIAFSCFGLIVTGILQMPVAYSPVSFDGRLLCNATVALRFCGRVHFLMRVSFGRSRFRGRL